MRGFEALELLAQITEAHCAFLLIKLPLSLAVSQGSFKSDSLCHGRFGLGNGDFSRHLSGWTEQDSAAPPGTPNVYKVCGAGAAKPRRVPPTPRSVPALASRWKSVGGVRTTAIVVDGNRTRDVPTHPGVRRHAAARLLRARLASSPKGSLSMLTTGAWRRSAGRANTSSLAG